MTATLFNLFSEGWTSASRTADPVTWQKRDYNKVADFLANFTMDTGRSWTKEVEPPVPDFCHTMANFICHSDGGPRRGRCSAAAWVVEAVIFRDGHCLTFPVAFRGIYFDSPVSSFTAETVALDDVVSFVSRLILRSSHTKRTRV